MPENAFQYFMGRNNARIVQLLEQNHEVSNFIQALLEHLVSYAEEEGVPFSKLTLDSPFVASDGNVKTRILVSR